MVTNEPLPTEPPRHTMATLIKTTYTATDHRIRVIRAGLIDELPSN